jgi:uncharacterized protein (TIGR02266 family)
LRQLLSSGRVKDVVRVRKDSDNWQRPEQVPEVAAAMATGVELPKLELARIQSWLAEFRGKPAHEVFGVSRDASLEQYRVAYFRMVKAYHPARLPAGSPAELHSACVEMFQFLAKLMVAVERGGDRATPPKGSTPPVANERPAPTAERSPPKKQFSYGPDEFVGIVRGKDMLEATVRVTHQNARMFTEHALINLATQGVLLPTRRPVPLGTLMNIVFLFEDPPHQIKTRGRVVWENVGVSSMTGGLGVRFLRLEKADREFIQSFMNQGMQPGPDTRRAG